MLAIPLQPVPAQSVIVDLAGQPVRLSLRYTEWGFFCSVFLDDAPLVENVLAFDRNLLVRRPYLSFVGDLLFVDVKGRNAPDWREFGVRYYLLYLNAAELADYQRVFGPGA